MTDDIGGGKVLQFERTDRMVLKQMRREAARELKRLYQITGGFVDPLPPDPELRALFEEGFCEL